MMLVQTAKDEDALYEKTGVDLPQFNNSVIKSGINKDPEFIKLVSTAQTRISTIQVEA